MLAIIFSWKRNKSFLRSSSRTSYPYPRTHTTLMVVPSSRPVAPEDRPTNTSVKQVIRRRPPLNRSIPPIPESKSNESIMSHVSRTSIIEKMDKIPPSDCIVIENRCAVETMDRTRSSGIPRPSVTKPSKDRKQKSPRDKTAETPRSPLMSVAHSVKTKISQLTRIGRNEPSTSMKGSQSFSGIRLPKSSIPKRIDQNANRVIKSSSMEGPSTSEEQKVESSKVIIPQSKEPLDDKIEEVSLAEQTLPPDEPQTVSVSEIPNNPSYKLILSPISKNDIQNKVDRTHQSVSVTLNEDVLVVTKETFDDAILKSSKRSDMKITDDEKLLNDPLVTQSEKHQPIKNIHSLPTEKVKPLEHTMREDREEIILKEQSTVEKEALKTPVDLENTNIKDQALTKKSPSKSPEHYVVSVKTPENCRKEHTILIKDNFLCGKEKVNMTDVGSPEKKLVFHQSEDKEIKSPERYIMTVKTPVSLRKHHIFMIDETEPSEKKTPPPNRDKTPIKQRAKPEESKSPERYVMTVKTPEALRKHHTFLIEEKRKSPDVEYIDEGAITEPIATVGPNVGKQIDIKEKKPEKSERTTTPERYVMTAVTPLAMRKYQTFMVEDRPKEIPIPYSMSADTVVQSKLIPSGSEENKICEEESITSQRFVMTATTPLFMRNHKTFRVEERDLSSSLQTETKRERPKKQKSMDETTPMSPEKYILTTTTPLMMRKYQTFIIEDRKQIDLPPKSNSTTDIESSYIKKTCIDDPLDSIPSQPIKPSEMYVLTATTPLPQRKTKVFVIEEKASHDKKTPELEKIKREKRRDNSKSPDRKYLFNIGARKSVPNNNVYIVSEKPMQTLERVYKDKVVSEEIIKDEKENEKVKNTTVEKNRCTETEAMQTGRTHTLYLDTVTSLKREASQSDRAELLERKASNMSGEMTSPEEEIPMDTHITPTEDSHHDVIHIQPIRYLPEMASPIAEESEQIPLNDFKITKVVTADISNPPVFHPPSPPKESPKISSKSTSPFKNAELKNEEISISAIIPETKTKSRMTFRSKSVDRKESKKSDKLEKERVKKEKRDEKEKLPKSPKIPLTTRSLRSASKMFTPAFFRKGESKIPKCVKIPSTSISMPLSPRSQMNLPFRFRKAPLAEFESSVVENSPAIENHPIMFEKWNNSPRNRRRHSAQPKGFSDPITEESDGNGNPTTGSQPNSQVFEKCAISPLMSRHDHDRGLIDDEILDQPMLVGDTFSHSESIDCLSAVRRMEFEADKATLISIDRSLAEDHDVPRRANENGNRTEPCTNSVTTVYSTNVYSKTLQDGLNEVEDIRSQLEKLQTLVQREMTGSHEIVDDRQELVRENDSLRRQLLERDQIINALRKQLATMKT